MKRIRPFMALLTLIFVLTACSTDQAAWLVTQNTADHSEDSSTVFTQESELVSASESSADAQTAITADVQTPETETTAAAAVDHSETHDETSDYSWDSNAVIPILFDGSTITAGDDSVSVEGSTITITAAGTYGISGSLTDGQLVVNTEDEDVVRLVLNGVDVRSSTGPAVNIIKAEKVVIVLAENTLNSLADGGSYTVATTESDAPNATLFSMADLTIYGDGALTVEGNANDGIASKDGLIIASGTIAVQAADDGIRGKDYLIIKDGAFTIQAQGDGLVPDNEDDPAKGYITITSGVIDINAGGDAIQAATDITIEDGSFNLVAGGGSNNRLAETTSAKGIKAIVKISVSRGSFVIDAADDALNSNGDIQINGGTFAIATGDDGMHADANLEINGGVIVIGTSYEGLESAKIVINAGDIDITASDDGINVASGNDGSGTGQVMQPGARPGRPGGRGQDMFVASGDYYLHVNGGYIVVEAAGDGLDVNGSIEMTDGLILVNGPTEQMNGAVDYDGYFTITGGFLVAAGSAVMAQAPDESSSQCSVLINFNTTLRGGTLFHIQDSNGNDILTFAPTKNYQSIAFSSPDLTKGATYEIYTGGTTTGTAADGLVLDGTYQSGNAYTSFTISSAVTMIGTMRGRF